MNDRSDIERVLSYWLEDGPATMPDRVVDVVARRISVRPQRRSWRLLRRSPMSSAFKYGIAAAAVLVIAIGGYSLLPHNGSIAGPPATATPVPIAPTAPTAAQTRPAVTCDDQSATCAGPLSAGQHASTVFQPALTYTVPDGWANRLDVNRFYTLHYNFTAAHTFQVISQVAIPDQDAACDSKPKAGVGNTVADWVTFLTSHPGLDASAPEPVTIGGYSGMRLSFSVASSWTERCPTSLGPAVMTMTSASGTRDFMGFVDDQQTTFTILDVAGETLIVMVQSGPEKGALDTLNGLFNPVIDTFRFAPAS